MEKVHRDFNTFLKIGNWETSIECGCGAWEGYNLDPLLLIISMKLLSDDSTAWLKSSSAQSPTYSVKNNNGVLTMRAKNNERILVLTEISAVLRIDPEEMLFDAHGDFIKGIKIAVVR